MALTTIRHALATPDAKAQADYFERRQQVNAGFTGTPREGYDLMTAQTPIAPGIACEPVDGDDVQGWWVRPAQAPAGRAVLFLHGGGYMFGSAKAYRGLASQLAARANLAVFVLEYPLAPEHPFPAAHNAVLRARKYLLDQNIDQIALAGDSAGGGLALGTLAETAAPSPAIRAILTYSPWVDLTLSSNGFTDATRHDPIFKPVMFTGLVDKYLNGLDARDPRVSPLFGLPETVPPLAIQVGTDELLLEDSTSYADLAAAKGGVVALDIFEDLHHVFQRCTENLAAARVAMDKSAEFINAHWE